MGVWVIGAGGHGKVVASTLVASGATVNGFIDPAVPEEELFGFSIIQDETVVLAAPAIIGVGNNAVRKRIAAAHDAKWVNAIHPTAVIELDVELGVGILLAAGSVIQPSAVIADHCIINTSASVDHDCRIERFVHIAPGARLAGSVTVEEGALIGLGAVILPGVRVGAWANVGAGAVVTCDVQPGETVVGVPAKNRLTNPS